MSRIFFVHSEELTSDYNGRMGIIFIIKRNGSGIHLLSPSSGLSTWLLERSEVIGVSGNTGSWSTGPHMFTLNQTNPIHSMDYEDTLHQLRR